MANFKLTQTGEQIQQDLNLLDSNSATSGQVLTANGTGGASWQNAPGGSGGGTQLHYHHFLPEYTTPSNPGIDLKIITKTADALSLINLRSIWFALAGNNGYMSSYQNIIIASIAVQTSTIDFYGFDTTDNTFKKITADINSIDYTDTVTPL